MPDYLAGDWRLKSPFFSCQVQSESTLEVFARTLGTVGLTLGAIFLSWSRRGHLWYLQAALWEDLAAP